MYSRILVPIDGSATADRGLKEAIALAKALQSHLVLMYAVEDFPVLVDPVSMAGFDEARASLIGAGREVLDEAVKVANEAGVSNEAVLRELTTLRASDAIVDEASRRRCELIVMGTHGRRGLNRLVMGSDAGLVTREATVPVLLVRPQD